MASDLSAPAEPSEGTCSPAATLVGPRNLAALRPIGAARRQMRARSANQITSPVLNGLSIGNPRIERAIGAGCSQPRHI